MRKFLQLSLFIFFTAAVQAQTPSGVPVYKIATGSGTVGFSVKASVPIQGAFTKWNATLSFTSSNVATGVLNIEIQAASVETGSRMKNDKLKGKDFFDSKQNPLITFRSTKIVQTAPTTFAVDGKFTLRGVTKDEQLTLVASRTAVGAADLKGTMAFDRKHFGMNSGIPFIKIADRVEVNVDLHVKRVSGPPLALK